jgi:hypothetical protein
MAKQRIHSFGGRSHSTPFTRGGEGLNYVSRQTDGAYAAIANAITGTLSGVAYFDSTSSITSSPSFVYKDQESLYIIGALSATNAYTTILTPTTDDELASKYYVDQQVGGHNGTVSGISYFNTATSVTSDPDFYYDTSTNKMFVTSGSLSAVRLGRKDYVEPSLYSVIRNIGDNQQGWDDYYFALGTFKQIWIQKEFLSTGNNLRYVGIEYSDVTEMGAKSSAWITGGYHYIQYVANQPSNQYAGIRTNVTAKKYGFRQITVPMRTGTSIDTQRVYVGITDNLLVGLSNTPAAYNVIAFRSLTSETNWTLWHSNGANSTSADSGVAYATDTQYLLRIEIYGIYSRFYINHQFVGELTTNSPSDTQDMYAYAMLTNTVNTGAKSFGFSHMHIMTS